MNRTQEEKLKELANELAKDIKTGEDLSSLSAKLVKLMKEYSFLFWQNSKTNSSRRL